MQINGRNDSTKEEYSGQNAGPSKAQSWTFESSELNSWAKVVTQYALFCTHRENLLTNST